MKTLSREEIQRMVGRSNSRRNVAGNNQESSSQGFATPSWVDENYLSKSFFSTLFIIHATQTVTVTDDHGQPVDEPTVTEITLAPNLLPGTTSVTDSTTGYTTTTVIAITSIEATKNFSSDGGVSALGLGTGGGGGGGATALNDLVDVAISNPSNGQILKYNSTTNKWENANESGGGGISMSDVWTALAASTSEQINASHLSETLNGYATQQWVGQQGYITDSALSGYATQQWVGQQGFLTSSAISDMATKTWVGQQGYLTSSAISDMATKTWANGRFLPLEGGTLTGPLTMNGNLTCLNVFADKEIRLHESGNWWWTLGYEAGTSNSSFNIVRYNNSTYATTILLSADTNGGISVNNGQLWVKQAAQGIRIGDGVIQWDSGNNSLKVIKSDGTAANLYATGGVSALGMSAGVSAVDAMTFNNLSVRNSIRFTSSVSVIVGGSSQIVRNASDSDCIYLLNYSGTSKETSNNYYYNQYDNVGLLGKNYTYSDTKWWIDPDGCALFQRVYLSNNVYLFTDGSNIKVRIGSTVYTLTKS